jgi:hypothetical protein
VGRVRRRACLPTSNSSIVLGRVVDFLAAKLDKNLDVCHNRYVHSVDTILTRSCHLTAIVSRWQTENRGENDKKALIV